MNRTRTAALLGAFALALPASGEVIFSENFDDGDAVTRWSLPIVDSAISVFDGTVNYSFPYTSLGVPAAPNGGGNAVFFEVNRTDNGPIDEEEAVAIIPRDFLLPTGASYRMTMDVYFNVERANGGTTEYGIFGVHTGPVNFPLDSGVNDDVPIRFNVSNGNGLAWQIDGDAGSSTDILRYEDPNNSNTGAQFGLGSFDDLPAGLLPGLPADATGPNAIGVGNNWISVGIERIGQTVSFSINGVEIDSIVDSDGRFDGGSIMIGYNDVFNSVANLFLPVVDLDPFDGIPAGDAYFGLAHFLLIDNIVVETVIPEPTSAALAVLGFAGLASRRRR